MTKSISFHKYRIKQQFGAAIANEVDIVNRYVRFCLHIKVKQHGGSMKQYEIIPVIQKCFDKLKERGIVL